MRGKYVLAAVFAVVLSVGVISFSPSAQAYAGDSDNIPKTTENSSPNNGDNNYDGTKDGYQSTVATTQNPNDTESPNAWVSLEVSSPESDSPASWQINQFNPVDPNTLPSQPDGTVFPVGMFGVDLSCKQNCQREEVPLTNQIDSTDSQIVGATAHLKLIFDRVIDTSKWTTRKYDPVTDTYTDYSPYVTISTQNIGYDRTVLEWNVVDGGLGDSDGVVNCHISDPISPTVPVNATVTSLTVPASKSVVTVAQPQLANTGFGTNLLIGLAVVLFAVSVAIFPNKSRSVK